MTFAEVHVKRSVILTDRLGPDILLVLTMKRQVFASWARAFESAGLLVSFERASN